MRVFQPRINLIFFLSFLVCTLYMHSFGKVYPDRVHKKPNICIHIYVYMAMPRTLTIKEACNRLCTMQLYINVMSVGEDARRVTYIIFELCFLKIMYIHTQYVHKERCRRTDIQ